MKALWKELKGISLVIAFIGIVLIIVFLSLAAILAPTDYWLVAIFCILIAVGIFAFLVNEARREE